MSLLANEADPFEEDEPVVLRSYTEDLLVDASATSSSSSSRGKSKKSDRKGSMKPVHWTKQKENVVQEKVTKRPKGHVTSKSSGNKTPPDSPKNSRLSEGGKATGKGVVTGQPSPNLKSRRKRYSQLGLGGSSEEEVVGEGENIDGLGFLVFNPVHEDSHAPLSESHQQGVGQIAATHTLDQPNNPFLTAPTVPSAIKSVGGVQGTSSLVEEQAWFPSFPSSSTTTTNQNSSSNSNSNTVKTTPFFPVMVPTYTSLGASGQSFPSMQQPGGGGPFQTTPINQPQDAVNPLLHVGSGEMGSDINFQGTNPFLVETSVFQPTVATPPAFPSTQLASDSQPDTASTVSSSSTTEDWSLSEDLRVKCVQQFAELEPVQGLLQGDKAREFFVLSKLPNQELSAIWRLSDMDQDNALSQDEFCIAMKLVLMRRKGLDIPAVLPDTLLPKKGTQQLDSAWETSPLAPVVSSSLSSSPPSSSPAVTSSSLSTKSLTETEVGTLSARLHTAQPIDLLTDVGKKFPTDSDELLVELDEEGPRTPPSSPQSSQPRIARIISLDDWLSPEEAEIEEHHQEHDSAALVKVTSDSDSEEKEIKKEFKPARPAPPKPRPLKPAQRQVAHSSSNKKKTSAKVGVSPEEASTSDSLPSASSKTTIPAKPPRPAVLAPSASSKKSLYSSLLSSPLSESPEREVSDEPDAGGFKFKQLAEGGGPSSSTDEASEKGHSRSTSLDLNKMLLAHGAAGGVFGGLPSAVPPKPPPKVKMSSPPGPSLLGGLEEGEGETEEGWAVISSGQLRPRSLSTGSMASVGGSSNPQQQDEQHHVMDTSTDALLLLHHKPPPIAPKPKKIPLLPPGSKSGKPSGGSSAVKSGQSGSESVSIAPDQADDVGIKSNRFVSQPVNKLGRGSAQVGPRRPPPPNKPNKLAELYQGGGVNVAESEVHGKMSAGGEGMKTGMKRVGSGGDVGIANHSGLATKDKTTLQASIRGLKENNEALVDINKNLEEKLFKLMEERVRLAREVTSLTGQS